MSGWGLALALAILAAVGGAAGAVVLWAAWRFGRVPGLPPREGQP